MSMKVLVVEDNSRLSERIKYRLGKSFLVDVADNGEDALDQVSKVEYGVIILDLNLPDITGLEVCRRMRASSIDTPILILTGADDMATKVELLGVGADDYMTKPFDTAEFLARINALGRRRARRSAKPIIQYRDISIDTESRKVKREGVEINLRRKEFDILEYLIMNRGRVLTREMIMAHAWSSSSTSWTSTVDVHIKHLRDKVDRPFKMPYIKTAYGLGYKVDAAQ